MTAPTRPPEPDRDRAGVRLWLALVALLIVATALVGAATRLTGSGLSITEWRPIMGVVPPLGEAAWAEAFAKYKEIPQYKLVNRGMSLDAFKTIFWWEWSHRLLARSTGVAFLLPFLLFAWRGAIAGRLAARLALIFALGALQGAVGWYMVASGLADRVDVSQYRLALHLGLAVLVLGLVAWTWAGLGEDGGRVRLRTVSGADVGIAVLLLALVYLQVLAGALVAGLKAGLTYNTWPLMDGALFPAGLWSQAPWWRNLFENAATVQLNHRLIAYLIAVAALAQAIRLVRTADDERLRISSVALAASVLAQIGLGIWTLLAWVPVGLGVAHQAGALAVFLLAVWHLHAVRQARHA